MIEPIIIEPFNQNWSDEFMKVGKKIRSHMGEIAVRIDHIGSTSIEGLDAKPIIDIQISVTSFDPFQLIEEPLSKAGFVFRKDNPELTKRYFREKAGEKRTHIHVRLLGHWSQQFSLLFRDYMKQHKNDCERYVKIKYELAQKFKYDRKKYVEGKDEIIWDIMKKADRWAQDIGWVSSETDI